LQLSDIEVVPPTEGNRAPLAEEASKFELAKRETLECRNKSPLLIGRQKPLCIPKAFGKMRRVTKQFMLNNRHALTYGTLTAEITVPLLFFGRIDVFGQGWPVPRRPEL